MKIFGRYYVNPRQLVLAASGYVFPFDASLRTFIGKIRDLVGVPTFHRRSTFLSAKLGAYARLDCHRSSSSASIRISVDSPLGANSFPVIPDSQSEKETMTTTNEWYRLLFLGATTYDVHRSIKNNERPPSEEQIRYLDDVLRSSGRTSPPMPAPPSDSR